MKSYYFADFTEGHYRKLLRLAKGHYHFSGFEKTRNHTQPTILLRHDIDFSPHRALALAKIENREHIKATYFVQLSSCFYNVFEHDIRDLFVHILKLGHQIGLHFDPTLYRIDSPQSLIHRLKFEKKILARLFDVEINCFSLHNPTLARIDISKIEYAGMINVYADYFQKRFHYISDSNGYWRSERLWSVLQNKKYSKLHLLLHPGWWQKKIMSPRERISRCIEGRALKQHSLYDRLLKKSGRVNVR